jgi:hypothetical protein
MRGSVVSDLFSSGFLPKFVKFLLDAFFQQVRRTDQRCKSDLRF